MATTDIVGQTLPLSLAFLDQHGQPMTVQPSVDSPPQWSNSNPAAETLSVAGDGLSATAVAIAPGVDTITVSVSVGGQSFQATLDVSVTEAGQKLTNVQIVPGTPA